MAKSTSAGAGSAIALRGAFEGSLAKEIQTSLCQGDVTVLVGTADAIPFPGMVVFNGSAADLTTLPAPKAGPQPLGDDGKCIELFDAAGKAHTVTTPVAAINGNKRLLTFNGTIGSNVSLQAWNGIWMVLGTPNGVTVT